MAISPKLLLLGIGAWAAALWATLQLARLETRWDGAICGVWGCGPSLGALVSCHAAWFIVLAPLAIIGRGVVPPRWRRPIGVGISALALAMILGVVIHEAVVWLPSVHAQARGYFARRCLFVIATWVDLPLVQLGVLSLLWWRADERQGETDNGRGRKPEAEAHLSVKSVNGYEHG